MSRPFLMMSDAEIERFVSLALAGDGMTEIGRKIGWNHTTLTRRMTENPVMRQAWFDGHTARQERNLAKDTKYWRQVRAREARAKMLACHAELEEVAKVASLRELRDDENKLSLACMKHAGKSSSISIGEIADILGWLPERTYQAARRLFRKGQFPYTLRAREFIELEEEKDVPLEGLIEHHAARQAEIAALDMSDWSFRDVLTPRLTRFTREVVAESPREAVACYVREWKASRKSGRVVSLTPEQERRRIRQHEYNLNFMRNKAERPVSDVA